MILLYYPPVKENIKSVEGQSVKACLFCDDTHTHSVQVYFKTFDDKLFFYKEPLR